MPTAKAEQNRLSYRLLLIREYPILLAELDHEQARSQALRGNLLFITLDGIDGAGKTTQLDRIETFLIERGLAVVRVRDPGSTPAGEAIRLMLLEGDVELHRRTEAFLYMAARCQLVDECIRPALEEGKTVLSDRFLLANVAYQSVGGETSAEELWELGRLATWGMQPDLTILLDVPAAVSLARFDRAADRMESRGADYMEAVRKRFLQEVPKSGKQHVIIDASVDADTVWNRIRTELALLIDMQTQSGGG